MMTKRLSIMLFAVAQLTSMLSAAEPTPPLGKPELIEGEWTYRGPRDILGGGNDTTVAIHEDAGEWTIEFAHTHYPRINMKGAEPTIRRDGPVKLKLIEDELDFIQDGKQTRYTFLCDPERLIMPAIVQHKAGEWKFRSGSRSFSARCGNDPFKIPVGEAQVEGIKGGEGFYSFEEAPYSAVLPRAQYLRFLTRTGDLGQLQERCRLIFDDYGWPRYERLLSTGERSHHDYQLRLYLAK